MSSVKRNFLYQSAYQLLLMIMPLITAPYIARVLGAERSGIYTFTHNISNWFVVFAMLGLETYGNRIIARVRDDEEELNKTFSELFILHLIVSFIVLISYFAYVFTNYSEYKIFLCIQGIYVASAVLDVNWFFFGIEKYKVTVIRNFFVKILTVILTFVLVKTREDLWVYCLIMAGGTFLSQAILWTFIPKYVKFQHSSMKSIVKHLKPMAILFVAVIAAHVYRMIDKAMLGGFDKMSDLGCYEYADKFVRIPLSLITALGTVMLSRMSHLFAKDNSKQIEKMLDLSALFVMFMSFALAFGLAGIAPEFAVIFLGQEYEESGILIIILAITIPLIGWNNFERTQILIPLQLDKVYTKAVCMGAIINVCLNVVLIYFFSARGAAIATIFSYLVVMWIQTKALVNKTNILSYFKYLPYPLFAGIIMFFVVRLIGRNLGISIFTVIIEIILGASIYVILSFIFLYCIKRELVLKLFKKVK